MAKSAQFIWATGIEDTFVSTPHPRTGRILDEYELTGHYDRWKEDIALAADLGINAIRYGIPWHKCEPRHHKFDWSWTDQVIPEIRKQNLEPIIDLVHYGTPGWIEDSFLNPAYPEYVSEYSRQFAIRYGNLCSKYTPLNEPRINAWYCGKLGWWPPYKASWKSFVRILIQLAKGICLTQKAISSEDPSAEFYHVDASDLYIAADPGDSVLVKEAAFRLNLVYLALDLVMGRVSPDHALWQWLTDQGVNSAMLSWFNQNRVNPDVIGFNMYPMFSKKLVRRTKKGGIEIKIQPCWVEELMLIAQEYHRRYPAHSLMITETASAGSMSRRTRWIEESVLAVRSEAGRKLPIIGYTFWPLFSLITWSYQRGRHELQKYVLHMGLYDLENGLDRKETPVTDVFRELIKTTCPHTG